MLETVDGLPAHPLLVHAVVVLVPLCALLLVAAAALPRARARLGGFLPLLAGLCLLLVPVTTQAGQWLQGRLGGGGPLVERHAELGGRVLPWVVGLLVLSLAVWWRGRDDAYAGVPAQRRAAGSARLTGTRGEARSGLLVQAALTAVCAVVAAGAVVAVVQAGDSGSRAVWEGVLD